MAKSTNVSHWIDLVKAGDSAAANRIWHHYFDRLVRSVRARLYGQNRAVSDEEDIVLSVFDSFYNAAENGRFPDLSDRDDLWRLLLRMSARKVVDKRRHNRRQRRGVRGHAVRHALAGQAAGDDDDVGAGGAGSDVVGGASSGGTINSAGSFGGYLAGVQRSQRTAHSRVNDIQRQGNYN